MTLHDLLPTLNAALNATSGVLLVAGWRAIRAGRRVERHRRLMLAALAVSTAFLAGYLVRVALTGTHRWPGGGVARTVYLTVLLSHTALAALVPPLVAVTLWLARKGRFPAHRRVARWTFPIWAYVSATGVLVYLMLYQLAPRLR